MLLDFKWYTVMNDGNSIREDEVKFEDLINTRSNDITEFGLYCPRNNGKVWLDPNTGIFYVGDKENKVELEILDMNDNVFKITDNPDEETIDNPAQWGRASMPLSKERADAIKAYLTKKGVSASSLSTDGKGGTQPVANPKDKDNNWKNRRVECILQK